MQSISLKDGGARRTLRFLHDRHKWTRSVPPEGLGLRRSTSHLCRARPTPDSKSPLLSGLAHSPLRHQAADGTSPLVAHSPQRHLHAHKSDSRPCSPSPPMVSPYRGSPLARLRTHRYEGHAVSMEEVAGGPTYTSEISKKPPIGSETRFGGWRLTTR
jgi:hypothetical protein